MLETLRLRSLSCPQCAGPLSARDGDDLLQCGSCGTSFLLRGDHGSRRQVFPLSVDRQQAFELAFQWLREQADTPSDMLRATVADARVLYVPIWEIRAFVTGWEFGKNLRNRQELTQEGKQEVIRLELVDQAVADGFLDERRLYEPATDLALLGVGRPHVTGRELAIPYLPGELESGAAVLAVHQDSEELAVRARKAFLHPPTGTLQRESHLALFGEETTLLYYPLWSLHYRHRGRLYGMTVDGRNGVVHAARAPADVRRRLDRLLVDLVVLAVVLAVLLTARSRWPAISEPLFWGIVPLFLGAWGVVSRFRLLREVVYHEPFSA